MVLDLEDRESRLEKYYGAHKHISGPNEALDICSDKSLHICFDLYGPFVHSR